MSKTRLDTNINIVDVLFPFKELWKEVMSRTSWKDVFEKNDSQWKAILKYTRQDERIWKPIYWLLTHKNIVKNHSGHGIHDTKYLFENFKMTNCIIL